CLILYYFFFQAEDGIRYRNVTGVQTCALPILNLTNHHLSFLTCRLFCSSLSFYSLNLYQLFLSLLFVLSIALVYFQVLLSFLPAYLIYLQLSFYLSFVLLSI